MTGERDSDDSFLRFLLPDCERFGVELGVRAIDEATDRLVSVEDKNCSSSSMSLSLSRDSAIATPEVALFPVTDEEMYEMIEAGSIHAKRPQEQQLPCCSTRVQGQQQSGGCQIVTGAGTRALRLQWQALERGSGTHWSGAVASTGAGQWQALERCSATGAEAKEQRGPKLVRVSPTMKLLLVVRCSGRKASSSSSPFSIFNLFLPRRFFSRIFLLLF